MKLLLLELQQSRRVRHDDDDDDDALLLVGKSFAFPKTHTTQIDLTFDLSNFLSKGGGSSSSFSFS